MPDCPLCGAIAPVYGEIEHAWDCPDAPPAPFAYERRMARLRGRSSDPDPAREKADLLRMALACEAGWDALKNQRSIAERIREGGHRKAASA